MLSFYYLPEEAFYKGAAPFSILLDPDRQFSITDYGCPIPRNTTYDNMHTTLPDILAFYFSIDAFYCSRTGGYYHFSAINCKSEYFKGSTILTINATTGKWMLRTPYSKTYP